MKPFDAFNYICELFDKKLQKKYLHKSDLAWRATYTLKNAHKASYKILVKLYRTSRFYLDIKLTTTNKQDVLAKEILRRKGIGATSIGSLATEILSKEASCYIKTIEDLEKIFNSLNDLLTFVTSD